MELLTNRWQSYVGHKLAKLLVLVQGVEGFIDWEGDEGQVVALVGDGEILHGVVVFSEGGVGGGDVVGGAETAVV